MREMSSSMATLLKSKKMVGENRPTHEVVLGGGGGVYNWETLIKVYYPNRDRLDNCPSVTKLQNGRILYMYTRDTNVYQSIMNDIHTFLTQDNTAIAETLILQDKRHVKASVFTVQGELYFSTNYTETNGDKLAKVEIYHSPLGDGSDWVLYSTVYQYDWVGANTIASYIVDVSCNVPFITEEGHWCIAFPKYYIYEGFLTASNSIAKSYDFGKTFATKYEYSSGILNSYTPHITRNIVKYKNSLYTLWNHAAGATGIFMVMSSNDDGDNWEIAINSSVKDWSNYFGLSVFSIYFTMASDSDYLYVFDESGRVYTSDRNPTAINDFGLSSHNAELDTEEYYGFFVTYIEDIVVIMTNGTRHYAPIEDNQNSTQTNQVVGIEIKKLNLQAKSITINRTNGMSSGLNIEFDNKDGILAPDKEGDYNHILWPNEEIIIKQGYGQELIQTYKGLIDTVDMGAFPQTITVSARDNLKRALDQTISTILNEHVLTFIGMQVEDMFVSLASMAGIPLGVVEETGITVAEKTFSWESYGDAFSWLSELVGFEVVCDEEGLTHFRKQQIPTTPVINYEFTEGEDIISLGYTINDTDLYRDIIVHGKSGDDVIEFKKVFSAADYWGILPQKLLKIDAPEATTLGECEAIALKAEYLMISRARIVRFQSIGIPHLQVGDFIQVTESSTTISEVYRITDLSTNQDSDTYTMDITCHWYSAGGVE